MELGRGSVQKLREIDIFGCDSLGVVSGEVYCDAVVDIEPLGMMIHLLDAEGRGGHEAESVNEVGELVFLVQLSIGDGPAGQAGECVMKFGIRKFPHVIIMRETVGAEPCAALGNS